MVVFGCLWYNFYNYFWNPKRDVKRISSTSERCLNASRLEASLYTPLHMEVVEISGGLYRKKTLTQRRHPFISYRKIRGFIPPNQGVRKSFPKKMFSRRKPLLYSHAQALLSLAE